jgi:hypothetical protein
VFLHEARPASGPGPAPRPAPARHADRLRLQARLTVGPADDPLEREAESVADAALGAAGPGRIGFAAVPVVQRKCSCADGDEECTCAQRSAARGAGTPGSVPGSVHAVVRGPGAPLEARVRAPMERWFGSHLSTVRVHTGALADRSAEEIGAHAYTVGERIVFRAGRYDPDGRSGQRLLAHELTHVLQQRAGGAAPLS